MLKDSAKTILCYGDSNTWGQIPKGERYPRSVRWTGALQNLLGDDYEVINEGLPGRTFVAAEAAKPEKRGITHLKSILKTHAPIDLVVIMLGTNDVKTTYSLHAEDIALHLEETIQLIQKEDIKNIIVVCPPEVIIPENNDLDANFKRSPELSKKLSPLSKKVAESYDCGFVNAQDYISSSKIDGFHLDVEAHTKLAEVLKEEVLSFQL